MTPSEFQDLCEQCADGATIGERAVAGATLTFDAYQRIAASGFSYGPLPHDPIDLQIIRDLGPELATDLLELGLRHDALTAIESVHGPDFAALVRGRGPGLAGIARSLIGPERASRHFHYSGPGGAPHPHFIRGSTVQIGSGAPNRGTAALRLSPSIKRRRIRDSVAAAGSFVLEPLLEYISSSDFELAAGTYTIQFSGQVWSRSLVPGATASIVIAADGTPVATHSEARGEPHPGVLERWGVNAHRDEPAVFDTSDMIVLAAPGVITLVNAGADSQRVDGILRVIPS